MDEVKPVARVPTVEHREPCESRGSRTVLGAPGGEIPPGDSTGAAVPARPPTVRLSSESSHFAVLRREADYRRVDYGSQRGVS